jgi:hypothetical protein
MTVSAYAAAPAKGENHMRADQIAASAMALAGIIAFTSAAQALTRQECSAKYKAAEAAGTLKGMKWEDFRKAECGSTTSGRASSSAATKPAPAPVSPFQSTWGAPMPGSGRPSY